MLTTTYDTGLYSSVKQEMADANDELCSAKESEATPFSVLIC
jgi:hypothetical protein